ncbi:hypothetical protein LINPERHAP1_LOCUS30362 [Linum perenne]
MHLRVLATEWGPMCARGCSNILHAIRRHRIRGQILHGSFGQKSIL